MWLGLIYLEVVKLVESGVNLVYFLWNMKSVMVAESVIYLKRLNSAKKLHELPFTGRYPG